MYIEIGKYGPGYPAPMGGATSALGEFVSFISILLNFSNFHKAEVNARI